MKRSFNKSVEPRHAWVLLIMILTLQTSCNFFSDPPYREDHTPGEEMPDCDPGHPDPPSGVTATSSNGEVTLSWTTLSADCVSSYGISWATDLGDFDMALDAYIDSVTSPYVHSGLSGGITYYYRIVAWDAYGASSAYSEIVSIEVTAGAQTDAEAVAADLAALEITYSGSDSAGSVTLDVGLSTSGSSGTTITWASSDTAVIGINGTVTRPAYGSGNAAVTLTATITKNAASDTKLFDLTVIETPLPAGTQDALSTGGVVFNMRYVPGKTTFTGTTDATQATVTSGYWIAETEVTYELWNVVLAWAVIGDGGTVHTGEASYTFANAGTMGDGAGDTNQHPVTTINWRDAMVWTNALTEYYNAQNGTSYAVVYTSNAGYTTPIRSSADGAFGLSVNYPSPGSFDDPYVNPNAKGFRLPTDAEWELAARYIDDANSDGDIMDAGEYYPGSHISGDTSNPYNTSTILGDYGWYSGNSSSSTHIVATKTANALGLYDMSGNVWEWDFDWYPGYVGTSRINRGGSWFNTADYMQVGLVFDSNNPYVEYVSLGFRPSRTP